MKLLPGLLFTSFLLGIYFKTSAQVKVSTIAGKVLTEDHLVVEAAAILLLRNRDSAIVKTAITGKSGAFYINNIKPGSYIIAVSKMGYRKVYKGPLEVIQKQQLRLDDFILQAAPVDLSEIVIVDHKRYLEVKPDKTILNVSRNVLSAGVSAFDVLRTAPGIKVGSDGDIFYHGGSKATIALNGREIKLDSQAMMTFLQGLQSADVDQIELISDPSVKYEASGTGGVINIILKKGKSEGMNGTVFGTGGYGSYYKSAAGGNWNFRSKAINFFGSLSLGDNKNYRDINMNREDGSSAFGTYYHSTRAVQSADYTAGIDVAIDTLHTLGMYVKGNLSKYDIAKRTRSNVSTDGAPDSTLLTTSAIDRHTYFNNVDVNYNGSIGHTAQLLSADADYLSYIRNSNEYLKSTPRPADTTYYRNIAPFHVNISSFKADYSDPLSTAERLEAGVKYSYTKYNNTQSFEELTNAVYRPTAYTSSFLYTEKLSRAYLNLNKNKGTFTYQLGLQAEHTSTYAYSAAQYHTVISNYTNFFPNVQLNYKISARQQLHLAYESRLDRPGYDKLDPTVSYEDQYNINSGNAYLKPAYSRNLKLSDVMDGKYQVSLYYTHVSDFWNFTYFRQVDSLLITTNRNIKNKSDVGVSISVPVTLTKWWLINMVADGAYFRFVDYPAVSNLNKGSSDFNFDLNQTFYLGKGWTASIDSHYETATYYVILHYRPVFYTDMGVNKRLSSRSTVNLSVRDVTNSDRNQYNTNYGNLNLSRTDKTETRYVRLTYSYSFGKKTVKATRRHTTGNSEEQGRVNSSNE